MKLIALFVCFWLLSSQFTSKVHIKMLKMRNRIPAGFSAKGGKNSAVSNECDYLSIVFTFMDQKHGSAWISVQSDFCPESILFTLFILNFQTPTAERETSESARYHQSSGAAAAALRFILYCYLNHSPPPPIISINLHTFRKKLNNKKKRILVLSV